MSDKKPRRKWKLFWAIGMICIALLVFVGPKLIPPNRVLQWLWDDPSTRISAGDVELGFLQPFSISDLELQATRSATSVQVKSIRGDRTFPGMLARLPDLGRLVVEQASIEIELDDAEESSGASAPQSDEATEESPAWPPMTVELRHGSIRLLNSDHQPVLSLSELNATMELYRGDADASLKVAPVRLLDNIEITPDAADEGLQWIAPLVADELTASARVSLDLQNLNLTVGDEESDIQVDFLARVILHEAELGIRTDLSQGILGLAGSLLDIQVPTGFRVPKDNEIEFWLQDDKVHSRGLVVEMVGTDIRLRMSGWVGLDESLSIAVEAVQADSSRVEEEFRIVGSLDNPVLDTDSE